MPIVLVIMPADFFDHGQSICLSQLFFDYQCPGCGMTRSIMHYIHGEFKTGYMFNNISVIVFPILVYLWVFEIKKSLKQLKKI